MRTTGDEQWSVADVAAHLGISPSTVRAYAAREQMPPPDGRLGRTLVVGGDDRSWDRPGRGGSGKPRTSAATTDGA